ncbi:hypothetical protein SEVIR_8G097301v4 [Setaria viridis]|uniref:Secreted protein n=1 Tax=Setaria viridis TaxID=4556 RepID=A0A4U6TGT0_SETVI|nr:hypothetical protein SEVIR_8G097301v2 [Setaria viridis]
MAAAASHLLPVLLWRRPLHASTSLARACPVLVFAGGGPSTAASHLLAAQRLHPSDVRGGRRPALRSAAPCLQ